jgi:4-coumarate--CoA ligase (photoactive yellow protein activation family)
MDADRSALSGWWQGPLFTRYLADLMRFELARLRPDLPLAPVWNDATCFVSGPLALDSLDRLKLASAVATALHFSSAAVPDRLREADRFGDWVAETRRVADHSDAAIAFKSSGSVGAPASVLHELPHLEQEIRLLAELFAPRTRVVTSVPSHHIYGFLFTILLPQFLGCEVLDARGSSPAALGALLQPGDLLVAFPTVWEAALEARVRWPGSVIGVSSGSAARPGLFRELRLQGLQDLFEIYGSTETGGIGSRRDGDSPFCLFGFWSKLDDDRVQKNAAAYWLPDVVTWVDQERLLPAQRRDRAVQVGGVNAYPSRVRSVLVAHGGVADAAVRLMRADEGERLKAFVVPSDPNADPRILQASLVEWVQTRLVTAERPRSFTFGAAVPVTHAGKPADWSIDTDGQLAE